MHIESAPYLNQNMVLFNAFWLMLLTKFVMNCTTRTYSYSNIFDYAKFTPIIMQFSAVIYVTAGIWCKLGTRYNNKGASTKMKKSSVGRTGISNCIHRH